MNQIQSLDNQYLRFLKKNVGYVYEHPHEPAKQFRTFDITEPKRRDPHLWLRIRYSWAIPDHEALQTIARYGPVVEMGAGTGYWAALLDMAGVDIVAYDAHPPLDIEPWSDEQTAYQYMTGERASKCHWHAGQEPFFDVRMGHPEVLTQHSDRSLFLCWPPFDDPMAAECLDNWSGQFLIYIGEKYGWTADNVFRRKLRHEFRLVENQAIPQWEGCQDELFVYERLSIAGSETRKVAPE